MNWYRGGGKRAFDLLVAALLVVALAPLMLLVAAAVWASLGRPILFRQARPGKNGVSFTILKFRTMRPGSSRPLDQHDEARRLTTIGSFLRKASLDELPELFNVLGGTMSLVGPRPLLTEYLAQYDTEQARRHEVRPGITGLAQVSGRNALPWEERFRLDTWYVDHASFGLDLRILARTAVQVFRRDGINQPGMTTVLPFRGSAPPGGED